jgi:hypothetical protein
LAQLLICSSVSGADRIKLDADQLRRRINGGFL